MTNIRNLICGLLVVAATMASAQDCEFFIQVVPPNNAESNAPVSIGKMLQNQLTRALSKGGVVASGDYGQFYLQGDFTDTYKQDTSGAPAQTAVHTVLTLKIADMSGSVLASESFDLRGVGTSEHRAYVNALQSISPRSGQFESFVTRAQRQMLDYFDRHYTELLSKAERAAMTKDFDQALYYSTLIPQCSTGYDAANKATKKYYQEYIDYTGLQLLKEAKAAFAISPNAEGAEKAYAILAKIDADSSSNAAALKFAEEIKKQTKAEYDFEVHKKYEDRLDIAKRKIDAARQIGVAYGRGQAAHTTNILWK